MNLPAGEPPTSLVAPSSAGLMARVGRRFMEAPRAVSGLPGTAKRMSLKLQAGMAEFLLVTRLRARSQPARSPDQSQDVLKRGAEIIDVTCKNWFATAGTKRASPAYRTRI
jgi:hypothetical protein